MAAEMYRRNHPNASPLGVRNTAETIGDFIQKTIKTPSVDELIIAIIPVYQRNLTHSDIPSILDF